MHGRQPFTDVVDDVLSLLIGDAAVPTAGSGGDAVVESRHLHRGHRNVLARGQSVHLTAVHVDKGRKGGVTGPHREVEHLLLTNGQGRQHFVIRSPELEECAGEVG